GGLPGAGPDLPDPGAATNATPYNPANSARWLHHGPPTVLIWTQMASRPAARKAPAGPDITDSTAAPSVSMVISTAAPAAASAGLLDRYAPSATSGAAFSGVRFHTRTSNPARSRSRTIGAPMVPVPNTATVIVCAVITHSPGRGPRPVPPTP